MSIGKLGQRTGLAPSAIRFYEEKGLLEQAARTTGARRVFDASAVERLQTIRLAQQVGFTLTEIRALLLTDGNASGHRWQSLASKKLAELKQQQNDIAHMIELLGNAVACSCPTAIACAKETIQKQSPRAARSTPKLKDE